MEKGSGTGRRGTILVKRVYEPPAGTDGIRVFVERLWPRGVSKESAHFDLWLKEISPSPELRKWYAHDPEKWEEFQERYRGELERNPEAVGRLLGLLDRGPVTLIYAARDEERNSAVLLKAFLEERA
jgi:uncharacterized protein YeaO (DUF488 family)